MSPSHFEDVEVGHTVESDSWHLSESEIIEFAEQFDPNPLHTDPDAARASPVGGLIASGWHTIVSASKRMVDEFLNDFTCGIGLGVDDIQWLAPVYAGDQLTVRSTVIDKRRSSSQEGFGIIRYEQTIRNTDGETVAKYIGNSLIESRE